MNFFFEFLFSRHFISRLLCDLLFSIFNVQFLLFVSSWFHKFAQKLNFQRIVGGEEGHEEGRGTSAVRTAAITERRDPEEATFLRGTGATRDFVQASSRVKGRRGERRERKRKKASEPDVVYKPANGEFSFPTRRPSLFLAVFLPESSNSL